MAKSVKKAARKKTAVKKTAKKAKAAKAVKKANRPRKPAATAGKRPAARKSAKKSAKKTPKKVAKVAKKTTRARRPAPPAKARKWPAAQVPPRPIRQPVEAVPTGTKARKNQAGLAPKELVQFRDLLLQKRRELVGDMSAMEREALRSTSTTNLSNLPLHMADMGTDNYEQEFTLGLVEKDRQLLREINNGLAKIQDGTYGLCEGTGKPISKARLQAQPWARYSIDYARELEKNPYRR